MSDDMRDMLQKMDTPFGKLLDIQYVEVTPDLIRAELTIREELATSATRMHGGVMMGFADNLGAVATFINLPEGAAGTTTLESKTNFLAAVPVGQKAIAETTPIHKGRTTQVWQTVIYNEAGKKAAIITQTQLILMPQ
ncbi:MAG: PaaI family thioesterase [Alphaproteobacteria bacterium]